MSVNQIMPTLTNITIQTFRNITAVTAEFSPRFNIFYGENGSGKTSLLEAIYYLGLGKSFRASQSARIIQHNTEQFIIVANIAGESTHTLGIERKRDGERNIKLDGDKQISIAPITKLLPIQFMSPMSYRFFHDGPKVRRQYLDWALFHVEQSFLNTWQQLQRILKQRNSALKLHQAVSAWDHEFIIAAEQIDNLRRSVFNRLEPICQQQLKLLLPDFEFKLRYQRGWTSDAELRDLLSNNIQRDRQLGYTYYGPQRADFQLLCEKTPVQDVLSQGQQKLAAYALHLALGKLLHQQTDNSPIYLIDDLPSELDDCSRAKIADSLSNLGAQVFISGISAQDLASLTSLNQAQTFHVEHGQVRNIMPTSSSENTNINQEVIT